MKRHSLSHGIGAFICMIAGGMLDNFFEKYIPLLYKLLSTVSQFLQEKLPYNIEISEQILLGILLMFLWGIGFYVLHED